MILVNGFVFGGTYAILAVGFALIFGVAKLLNLSYTAFYMAVGYFILLFHNVLGIPLVFSSCLAILSGAILGLISYKLCFSRIKEHGTAVLIVSVAMAMLFQEILLLKFGGQFRRVPHFITGYVDISGNRISYQHLVAVGVSVITLIGLWLLLTKTKLGIAIRAVADDSEVANLMRMDVNRIYAVTMVISISLAGIASAIISPIFMVHPLMWLHPLIIVLAAAVLGGLGSIKGSVIAAIILGFAETIVVTVIPGGGFLRGAVSLSVMIVVLLVRPEGFFGVIFEKERL